MPDRTPGDPLVTKPLTDLPTSFPPAAKGRCTRLSSLVSLSLFERCRELSTAACPLYDECGDKIAQS